MNLFDLIFPKYCVSCRKLGSYLCDNCFSFLSFDTKTACVICKSHCPEGYIAHSGCLRRCPLSRCFSALSYNKTARKLIYNFKNKPYVTDLKKVLTDLFFEGIIQKEGFIKELENPPGDEKYILVPVPLDISKLRRRGYNQAEILAKELGKKLNLNVCPLLQRTKNSFEINKQMLKKTSVSNIIVVDDLTRTGSTLLECANVLKKEGAKRLIGLTLVRG